jgi:hypothetical protein
MILMSKFITSKFFASKSSEILKQFDNFAQFAWLFLLLALFTLALFTVGSFYFGSFYCWLFLLLALFTLAIFTWNPRSVHLSVRPNFDFQDKFEILADVMRF